MTYSEIVPVRFVRMMRNKSGWLAFLWLTFAITNFGRVADSALDRSWIGVGIYTTFLFVAIALAICEVREWRLYDRMMGGAR